LEECLHRAAAYLPVSSNSVDRPSEALTKVMEAITGVTWTKKGGGIPTRYV